MTNALVLALAVAMSAQNPVPSGAQVVATVDGVEIKADDVNRSLWEWYGNDVVEELIVNQMVTGALKREGVTLDQKAVDSFLGRLIQEAAGGMPPGVNVDEELRKQGLPRTRLAARAATEIGLRQMTEARFKPETMRKIAWIMIKPQANDQAAVQAAKMNADQALLALVTQPWSEVVKERSQDPSSAARNGELGWFALDELPAEVSTPMTTMEAGKHTGVIVSQGIYAIYYIVAIGPPPEAEVDGIKAQYVARNLGKVYQAVRAKAVIERKG